MSVKDPDYFKLQKSQYEINKNYLELVQQSLMKNGGHFSSDVVINNEVDNYRITKGSLERLQPGKWFNDEIINAYVNLINSRDKANNLYNVFTFNTYFYTLLEQMLTKKEYIYKKLERIVNKKKTSLKNYKMLVMPVNLTHYHWLILVADLVNEKFYIVDSMKTSTETAQKIVQNFKVFF